MKKLIIVESPAKIKTIKKFLNDDFKITSTMGHIKDLPTKTMGITRGKEIEIEYIAIENKEKTIAEIKKMAKDADMIYLAPDPDREGEIIAFHALQEIEKIDKGSKKQIFRIAFNEITKSAVIAAINNPSKIDYDKVAAQQARRVLDRWVGYEVSPILWKKITKGLSAGRVQSVALRLICDREEAIYAFQAQEYWSIEGTFKNEAGTILAMLTHIGKTKAEIKTELESKNIIDEISKSSFIVASIEDKIRTKNPVAPFMTSSLQQAAYNRIGFSVKKSMEIAQNLYEGVALEDGNTVALITYMRTDSLRVSDSAIDQVRPFIEKTFGKKYLPNSVNIYEKKGKGKVQDAHEAIRPIDVSVTPDSIKNYLSKDQWRLYELIWQRFVASQMESAQFAQRQVIITDNKYIFKATGSTLIFDGFLKIYAEHEEENEKEENSKIPSDLAENQKTKLAKLDPKQHFTQAPARYSEATLVKELEKEGIGRPSTYATILNTIRARSYTNLEKKRFIPTELGMAVTKLLVTSFPHIMDLKFTANMEEDLDKIAAGELNRDVLLNSFYEKFENDLKAFKEDAKKSAEVTSLDCPECKTKKLLIRFGKSGEFLGCSNFPECNFASNFIRDESGQLKLAEKEQPKFLDQNCPECQKPLREVQGRFGKFVSCSGYPECKYIQQNKAGFNCPNDGGQVVQRSWKKGKFWGCSNYPNCKFALFGEIEETPCPKCNMPALLKKTNQKTEKTTLDCHDKKCGYSKDITN